MKIFFLSVESLKIYEINRTCPQLFNIVSSLNTVHYNSEGISAQELIDHLQTEFGQNMDKKEVRRIFELFLKEKTQECIYLADIKSTCASLNLDYTHHEILTMLKDASALKNELTFDEFYVMMTECLIHIN